MMNANLKALRAAATNASIASRCLATQAAPKSAASHSSSSHSSSSKPGEVKISSMPSGASIASVASDSALARVAIVFKAGARYEPADQLGLTHALRLTAGQSTENHTSFGLVRNIDYFGGRLVVAGTRDTVTYLLEVHNDEEILPRNFALLAETVARPAFKRWELPDNTERALAELAVLEDNPHIKLAEALHAVAWKGGLRKSLYMPRFMLNKHTGEQLKKFIANRYVSPVVVGVGVEHQQLVDLVGSHLSGLSSHQPPKCVTSFIGGETHLEAASPLTYVALATEGVGLKNTKEALALSLFQTILGNGPQIASFSGLSSNTRLGKAVGAALGGKGDGSGSDNVAVSAFNFAYEETGLFGINLIAPKSADVTGLLKAAVKELRAAASSVTDAELADAKKNLKTAALLAVDTGDALATELGAQLALVGSQVDTAKEVDAITAADVKSVAGRLLKGKLALATIGSNAPYLDDLV